jgi:hypothetical protein
LPAAASPGTARRRARCSNWNSEDCNLLLVNKSCLKFPQKNKFRADKIRITAQSVCLLKYIFLNSVAVFNLPASELAINLTKPRSPWSKPRTVQMLSRNLHDSASPGKWKEPNHRYHAMCFHCSATKHLRDKREYFNGF